MIPFLNITDVGGDDRGGMEASAVNRASTIPSNTTMKKLLNFRRIFGATCLAFVCIAAPGTALARDRDDRDWDRRGDHRGYDRDRHDGRWDNDHRRRYYSHPRSRFGLSFGTGYRGRGYYYGPPGVPYYYQAPGVIFYSSRASVPSRYLGRDVRSDSVDVAVQSALKRRGYYRGPIDGDIGPGSRSAIARYQRDRGLAVTGSINSSLLRSLGIR